MVDLGFRSAETEFAPPYEMGFTPHVSPDGSTVVGQRLAMYEYTEAVRWTEAEGVVGLGNLPGYQASSRALNASYDGSVVVGLGTSDDASEAFRWTEESGLVGLGDFPGRGFISEARAVSDDGSVIAGFGFSELDIEAFRWTEEEGMVGLGYLPSSGHYDSRAHDISADGKVIVGVSSSGDRYEPFRWTAETGMVGLGERGSEIDSAHAVSGDGSIIVGVMSPLGTQFYDQAFIWDEANGTRNLRTVLTQDYGLDLGGGSLTAALDISADGRTIVGFGLRPEGGFEAWIAVVPEPSSVVLAGFAVAGFGLIAWQKRRIR